MKMIVKIIKNCLYPLTLFAFSSSLFAINHVVSNPQPGDPILQAIKEVGYYNGVNQSSTVSGSNTFYGEYYVVSDEVDNIVYLSASNEQSVCNGPSDVGAIGTHVMDVSDKANPVRINVIPPQVGTAAFNAMQFKMPNGDKIFIRTPWNGCAIPQGLTPGQQGMEIFKVNDPMHPVLLKAMAMDDINATIRTTSPAEGLNLSLGRVQMFMRDNKPYLALAAGTFGRFQIFDMSDPANPVRVMYWGTEMLRVAELGLPVTLADIPTLSGVNYTKLYKYLEGSDPVTEAYPFSSGTPNRVVNNAFSVIKDGQQVLLPSNEAGLVLLDISDFGNPKVISVAKNLTDGFAKSKSVSSRSADITNNGKVVVEANNDGTPTTFQFNILDGSHSGTYKPSSEPAWTKQILSLPGQKMGGAGTTTKYVGTACNISYTIPAADAPGQIAIAIRGTCAFTAKADNIQSAGYAGFAMINNRSPINASAATGMAGSPASTRDIPGIGVTYAEGLMILGLDPNTDPVADPTPLFNLFNSANPSLNTEADLKQALVGMHGATIEAASVVTGLGQIRIWDFKDPKNPVLASTFDTLCSNGNRQLPTSVCPIVGIRGGNYIPNYVQVNGNTAYVAWPQEGVVMIDVKDPYNPVEIGRFGNAQASNGVSSGLFVNKDTHNDCLYMSDISLGMYLLNDGKNACKAKNN